MPDIINRLRIGPRVSTLDAKGKLLARLGGHTLGNEPGRFYRPHAMAVDSKGELPWRRCRAPRRIAA